MKKVTVEFYFDEKNVQESTLSEEVYDFIANYDPMLYKFDVNEANISKIRLRSLIDKKSIKDSQNDYYIIEVINKVDGWAIASNIIGDVLIIRKYKNEIIFDELEIDYIGFVNTNGKFFIENQNVSNLYIVAIIHKIIRE